MKDSLVKKAEMRQRLRGSGEGLIFFHSNIADLCLQLLLLLKIPK